MSLTLFKFYREEILGRGPSASTTKAASLPIITGLPSQSLDSPSPLSTDMALDLRHTSRNSPTLLPTPQPVSSKY